MIRTVGTDEPGPLPEDPNLAAVAKAITDARTWGFVVDDQWRLVYMSDDIRLSNGRLREMVPMVLGAPIFSERAVEVMLTWSGQVFGVDSWRASLHGVANWVAADVGAAFDGVDPRLLEGLEPPYSPADPATAAISYLIPALTPWRQAVTVFVTAVRIRDADGRLAGTAMLTKPEASMSVLGTMAGAGDVAHFGRMQTLARLARRPAAILFADLEGSSALARRLSTANYFALGRRIVRMADQAVVEFGGMVGRHAGDGLVAFFLSEIAGSESRAAAACIEAARDIRARIGDAAERSGLPAEAVVLRFGLHWGATLHIGHIVTPARAEVNALGEEMNEAARIEACATGGRILASKALVERLDGRDADALGIATQRLEYTALGELPTATEKARRDAPSIAVCEL